MVLRVWVKQWNSGVFNLPWLLFLPHSCIEIWSFFVAMRNSTDCNGLRMPKTSSLSILNLRLSASTNKFVIESEWASRDWFIRSFNSSTLFQFLPVSSTESSPTFSCTLFNNSLMKFLEFSAVVGSSQLFKIILGEMIISITQLFLLKFF